ncbi:unnamed protein product, partial [Mesorhabditis spiculigera]
MVLSGSQGRLVVAVAGCLGLLLYHLHVQDLDQAAKELSAHLLSCQEQTESIVARLQVMFEHRQLASELLGRERRGIETERQAFETRNDLNNCQADPAAFNSPPTVPPPQNLTEALLLREKEILQLKENLEQLQHVLEQRAQEIDKLHQEAQEVQKNAEECQNKLSLQAAVGFLNLKRF